jgi:acetyl esterase/lipase
MRARITIVFIICIFAQTGGHCIADAVIKRDIPYAHNAVSDQVLDLYLPKNSFDTVVVFIHGGSLQQSGEQKDSPAYAHVCDPFVNAGYGCASVNYRLAPANKWPSMPEDVAAAVKWIKTNENPKRIFLFGHSSGCLLAAILAANPKYLGMVGMSPADIAGVIPMGCTLSPMQDLMAGHSLKELEAMWPKSDEIDTFPTLAERLDSDPSRFISKQMPPTLVIVAHQERFFPSVLEEGAQFVRRLLELERPADLVIVPGKHMTSIADIGKPGDPTFAAIREFLEHPDQAGADSR